MPLIGLDDEYSLWYHFGRIAVCAHLTNKSRFLPKNWTAL